MILGTSMNDVWRFLATTYHVWQFLPYNIQYSGFFGPSYLPYSQTSFMDVPLQYSHDFFLHFYAINMWMIFLNFF